MATMNVPLPDPLYDTKAAIAALADNDPVLSDARWRHNRRRCMEGEAGDDPHAR